MIRWPNLLMLVITQMMLNYLVIGHMFNLIHIDLPLASFDFNLLVLSTIFMAAFGYIFNDAMDEETDAINKNDMRIIGNKITRVSALLAGWIFLFLALSIATYLSWKLAMWQLIFIHISIAIGLWFYSVQLKKTVLIGNLLISLFTGFSVFIIWLYHLVVLHAHPILLVEAQKITEFVSATVLAYAVFAFLISLIREVIKDIEDQEGDKKAGMKTFVIQFGLKKTKVFTHGISSLMLTALAFAIYITYSYQWLELSIYLAVAVGIPLIYLMMNLRSAENKKDFKDLSFLAKIIMIAGILSTQLFYISYGT